MEKKVRNLFIRIYILVSLAVFAVFLIKISNDNMLSALLLGLSISCSSTALWTINEETREWNKALEAKKETKLPQVWSPKEREILMLEYSQIHNEILQRNQYGWLIISIFTAASFIVSFGVESTQLLTTRYLISLVLLCFCALTQKYYDSTNSSCWDRRVEIEKRLGIDGPQIRYNKLKGNFWYKIGSSTIWFFLWFFLITVFIELIVQRLIVA